MRWVAASDFNRFLLLSHVAQDRGFQVYGANVQFVVVEGAVDKIESGGEVAATAAISASP